jgi:hypothetical protein
MELHVHWKEQMVDLFRKIVSYAFLPSVVCCLLFVDGEEMNVTLKPAAHESNLLS